MRVYNALQQIGIFSVPEIEDFMSMVDTYLFEKNQHNYFVFIAEGENDNIAGYVCCGPQPTTNGIFRLYHLAAIPGKQPDVVRKHLLQFVIRKAVSEKSRLLVTHLSSKLDFEELRHFYLQNTFSEAGRVRDYYGKGCDQIILNKRLPK